MRQLFSEYKQKIMSTMIVTVAAFVGFETLSYIVSLYQLKVALFTSFYIYAIHVLWLMFVFDLHLKQRGVLATVRLNYRGMKMIWEALKLRFGYMMNWRHLRHFQNHLVLPGILYWSCVTLIFLNPFNYTLKQILILSTTLALNVGYWFMKEHVSRRLETHFTSIKFLSLVKLYAAFLTYSAMIGVAINFGYDPSFLVLGIATLTFLLVYQALFQHDLLSFSSFLWIVIIALLMAGVSIWVYGNWNTEYFTAGLVMLAVYNTLWGLLHHYLDRTLTRTVLFEYLLMTIFIISFIFASHNFNQRIV